MQGWPDRVVGNINEISDRAAMGLPQHYVAPRVPSDPQILCQLVDRSVDELVRLVQAPTDATADRLAAGTALALRGDPRVRPHEPEMIEIAGGTALIGTEADSIDDIYNRFERFGVRRNWIEKETPRFEVQLPPYRIARYPVTNLEYLEFLKKTEFPEIPTSWPFGNLSLIDANRPVYTVTPEAADAYVNWLSAVTSRSFRLATEYEWEYAAAGPAGFQYPWGDEVRTQLCNTMETGLLSTSPVGMFPDSTSPFGVSDMAGNVEEYVSSHYHPYPGGVVVEDDLFKKLGYYRVARGGAFNRFIDLARCQRRHGAYPKSLYAIGFRIAETIEE